ncbi:MAG: transcription termination/antitermination protein NusG [Dehalococcoidia bacterium]|nr:transcription termination/antitermination protein NusG [Dehalococcoidia bacterium]
MAKRKTAPDQPTVEGEEIGADTELEDGALAQPISEGGQAAAEDGVAGGYTSLGAAAEGGAAKDDEAPTEPVAIVDNAAAEEGGADDGAAADAGEDEVAAEPEVPGDWYVIHTYSGYENKVKTNLQHRIQSMDVSDKIFEVVIPTEEEIEIREGQRRTVSKKIFPGYVLVRMNMDDESWYVVRNTPGVTGFVAPGGSATTSKPTPLAPAEVANILRRMKVAAPKVKVGFSIGESVRIIEGPFQDFVGSVDEINVEKGKVKVLVSFFGRETPVELDFLQVERI